MKSVGRRTEVRLNVIAAILQAAVGAVPSSFISSFSSKFAGSPPRQMILVVPEGCSEA